MSSYTDISGFEDVYLEDSWVLDIAVLPGMVTLEVEAVLLESHPAYEQPRPGEAYCYRRGTIRFNGVAAVTWTGQGDVVPAVDASGEQDFGSVDAFEVSEGQYVLEGDFGRLEVSSDPPVLELTT